MADNTDEEHLNNPTENQSENPPDEINPTTDTETSNPNRGRCIKPCTLAVMQIDTFTHENFRTSPFPYFDTSLFRSVQTDKT